MDTSSADYKRYQAWLAANPPPPAPAPRPAPGPPPKTIDQCLVEFQKCDRPHRIPAAHAPAPAPSSVRPAPAPAPMFAPVPAPMTSNYATNPGKDCYNASYDLGYQGVKSQAAIQALCDANPKCTGAVQHSGGDWWLLSQVNAPPTNSPGSMCIMKPGIGMPVLSAPQVSSGTQGVANAPAGSMSIGGYNWTPYLNNDYPTSAMQYLPNQTLTQCAQACATTSGCKGFATGAAVSPTVAGDCSLKNAWTPSGLQPNTNLNAYQYLPSGTQGVANAPAGSMSIGGYNWTPYLNNDYPTSAMQYLPNQTLTQCAQACATTSGCKGFATGAAVSPTVAGDCSLKNAWTPSGLQPNTNLNAYQYLPSGTQGVANAPAGSMSIGGYNWTPYLNNDYPTSAMQYLPNQTLTQCAQACATTSGCKGFATGAAVSPTVAGDCSLKNAWTPTGLTPNTNLNAYQYLGASGTSGYAMEGSYLGGLVSSKRDWTLIMILFVLVVLLWIIAKKM